jgi:hypothetical protein
MSISADRQHAAASAALGIFKHLAVSEMSPDIREVCGTEVTRVFQQFVFHLRLTCQPTLAMDWLSAMLRAQCILETERQ